MYPKSPKDRYFCLQCPDYVAFPSNHQLYLHHKNVPHESDNTLQCPHCPKVYRRNSGLLELHIAPVHNPAAPQGIDLFTCASCGRQYKDKKQVSALLHDTHSTALVQLCVRAHIGRKKDRLLACSALCAVINTQM